MSGVIARAYAPGSITGGAANRFRYKIAPTFTLADMLGLVDALVALRRDPDAILSSMEIAGAQVVRLDWRVEVYFEGIQASTVLGAPSAIAFWRAAARRRLRRLEATR